MELCCNVCTWLQHSGTCAGTEGGCSQTRAAVHPHPPWKALGVCVHSAMHHQAQNSSISKMKLNLSMRSTGVGTALQHKAELPPGPAHTQGHQQHCIPTKQHWDPTEQLDSFLVFSPSQSHALCTKPKSSSQSGGSFRSSLSLPQHHL